MLTSGGELYHFNNAGINVLSTMIASSFEYMKQTIGLRLKQIAILTF